MTLVSLLFTAVLSFSASSLRQYHFVNRSMSWTEAQRYCRENHTDLTTVNNMNDLKNIINTVNGQTQNVWIGLHKMNNLTWKWSLGDPAFYTGNESQYRYWGVGQPDNKNNDDCVYMEKDGMWQDASSTTIVLSFICYNDSSKQFILVENNQHMKKKWYEAQRYCRENHTDLASVRNQIENEKIKNLSNQTHAGNNQVWIGLFRDSWVWSDNSTSSFRHWDEGEGEGEPNPPDDKNCTSVTAKGTWINHELILYRENMTWTDALEHCRRNQMDLVCVESEEIQRGVMNVMKDASSSEVWMGLRHSCVVGIWFWVSGEIMCYQNWAEGNGTGEEDCSDGRAAAIQTGPDHTWISLPGSHKLNFICSKIP